MSEIRLRAIAQINKISRELEKAEKVGGPGKFKVPTSGKFKAEQLAEAGISTTTANRYEQLAAPEEQLAPLARAPWKIILPPPGLRRRSRPLTASLRQ